MKAVFAKDLKATGETSDGSSSVPYPLVLDLDGTLLRTDLLLEAALHYVKQRPLGVFLLLWWACHGTAFLKHQLASRTDLAVQHLPINERLAQYARQAAEKGRTVVAATAANRELADRVCARFSFISAVFASCDKVNLKGSRKAAELNERFPDGYVYAGDAAADLAVWRSARGAIFAGRDRRVLQQLSKITDVEADLSVPRAAPADWRRALRLHQWAKNGLLFLPLMLAGELFDPLRWLACIAAFVAIGLTASATYLVNDLFDLEADRQHWTKRNRALAAGTIGILPAIAACAVLLASGITLAALATGLPVVGLLLLYCAVTLSYSLYLKRLPVLDVTVLASLFTLRLVLGAAAAQVRVSAWLLVFSMFLFLSLALAKRSTEIGRKGGSTPSENVTHGRGYVAADASLVAGLGASSALAAVHVMVLYLINDAFSDVLYGFPQLLWAAPVLIGLWLGRVWLLCGRGILHDDPVVFAVSDKVSLALGAGVFASFAGAALIA
jgi:4-hydroxybenzoate polyprenyltransferase